MKPKTPGEAAEREAWRLANGHEDAWERIAAAAIAHHEASGLRYDRDNPERPVSGISKAEEVCRLSDVVVIRNCQITGLTAERDALAARVAELESVVDEGRIASEPFDDVKPRRWTTDYEKLARFHQRARAALAGGKP